MMDLFNPRQSHDSPMSESNVFLARCKMQVTFYINQINKLLDIKVMCFIE